MNSNSIQIYNGEGASNICVKAWKRELKDIADDRLYIVEDFNQSYTAGFDRGNVALVIIPGGDSIKMLKPCETLADKINTAVADQSSFLGSCAGAYVSSAFMTVNSIRKLLPSDTNFNINPVPYISKYYMPNSTSTSDPENKTAVDVEWLPSSGHFESKNCRLYHAFGPAFPLEQFPVHVKGNCRSLVRYITEGNVHKSQNAPAAILYSPPGNRSCPRLFTGVHPEIGIEDIRSHAFAQAFDKPDHPHIEKLVNRLEDSELMRKEICRSWFSELGLSVKKNY
ncbi:MAG: hypothetical protein H0U49_06330 [Parachlamydiaceae bacterium]|nr:hypothetical protein [Parachlamydiaceae bacterium]